MMNFNDVSAKIKRRNRILFNRESLCLQPMLQGLRQESHKVQILWAFDCVEDTLTWFERLYPEEMRPRTAFSTCRQWAAGQLKMPVAKQAILDCHGVAKEITDPVGIALCHAVGQGISTVHVGAHAPGLVFYELTAIVQENGLEECEQRLAEKIAYYNRKLVYWHENPEKFQRPWAKFIK